MNLSKEANRNANRVMFHKPYNEYEQKLKNSAKAKCRNREELRLLKRMIGCGTVASNTPELKKLEDEFRFINKKNIENGKELENFVNCALFVPFQTREKRLKMTMIQIENIVKETESKVQLEFQKRHSSFVNQNWYKMHKQPTNQSVKNNNNNI